MAQPCISKLSAMSVSTAQEALPVHAMSVIQPVTKVSTSTVIPTSASDKCLTCGVTACTTTSHMHIPTTAVEDGLEINNNSEGSITWKPMIFVSFQLINVT